MSVYYNFMCSKQSLEVYCPCYVLSLLHLHIIFDLFFSEKITFIDTERIDRKKVPIVSYSDLKKNQYLKL